MIQSAKGIDAEALVGKTLCSCFLSIDGTITLRWEMVSGAAGAIAACLRSHGFVNRDAPSVEQIIRGILLPNGQSELPVSVPASVLARRICAAMRPR